MNLTSSFLLLKEIAGAGRKPVPAISLWSSAAPSVEAYSKEGRGRLNAFPAPISYEQICCRPVGRRLLTGLSARPAPAFVRAAFAVVRARLANRGARALRIFGAILVVAIDGAIAIVIDTVVAGLRLRRAVVRTIQAIFARIADTVAAGRRRSAIDLTVETVFTPFAHAVTAA